MKSTEFKVVCFGEILWDNLPDGRKPGGAPMNVAYHLKRLGIDTTIISSVGDDRAGKDLLAFLQNYGFSTRYVQISEQFATSEVLARIGENNEVSYEIVHPVAWDHIQWNEEISELIGNTDVLVYGSLASRSKATRDTLLTLLDKAKYRVFDVNLRAPHYSKELLGALLAKADIVKLNAAELILIATWYGQGSKTEAGAVQLLMDRFGIKELLVTKGAEGASYYARDVRYDCRAYKVKVADTIGSGDSFLSAFLAMKLRNEPVEIALEYSAAMGAFVTSQAGACPQYSKSDLEGFIHQKKMDDILKLVS